MSRTLFFYVFKDLLKVFLLTSGTLAGIMSFGGLLRPLTDHGLSAAQVGKVLMYFMPAMQTYSLPVAALFATTVVYGRLAADNEITACRAAGISYLSISTPALVLGLFVAIFSLVFLCFIVPTFTLKVERVIYSNLAQLVAHEIEQTRQVRFEEQTIYANSAEVAPLDPDKPHEQIVTLNGIMIVAYRQPDKARPQVQIPNEFYIARRATVTIRTDDAEEDYSLEVELEGGIMFPREFAGNYELGMDAQRFGPVPIPSPIEEDMKFMDIGRLHALYADRTKSRRVRGELERLVRGEQSWRYLERVMHALNGAGVYSFETPSGDIYELTRGESRAKMDGVDRVAVGAARVSEERNDSIDLVANADEVHVTARATADNQMVVTLELHRVRVQTEDGMTARELLPRTFVVEMPPDLRELSNRTAEYYLAAASRPEAQKVLKRELIRLGNGIQSELHARASFAISCLVLVIVGCALGMMFRSGNYLSAFALSVIPALLCIALIITGQHTCENIPRSLENFRNPLSLGLALIWSGNIAVMVLAVVLMGRLQRQ